MGALVLIVILLVMIVGGILAWRSLGTRDDPVERHGRALDTLRQITEASDAADDARPDTRARSRRAAAPSDRPLGVLAPTSRGRRWAARGPLVITGTALLLVALAVAVVLATRDSGEQTGRNPADHPAGSSTSLPTTTTTAPPPPPPPPQLVTGGATPRVSVPPPFTMVLAATQPCWVSVTTPEGASQLVRTLEAGEQATVDGSGPLLVRLGNAPAITLTVNGTAVDLGGLDQVDSFTVGPG